MKFTVKREMMEAATPLFVVFVQKWKARFFFSCLTGKVMKGSSVCGV